MIGVVVRRRLPKKAKGGQKDYYVTMRLVDSSTPYGITAIALRPYKEALPVVEVGDVVLLREFKVRAFPSCEFPLMFYPPFSCLMPPLRP